VILGELLKWGLEPIEKLSDLNQTKTLLSHQSPKELILGLHFFCFSFFHFKIFCFENAKFRSSHSRSAKSPHKLNGQYKRVSSEAYMKESSLNLLRKLFENRATEKLKAFTQLFQVIFPMQGMIPMKAFLA